LALGDVEELWEERDKPYSIHQQLWPTWDDEVAKEDEVTLIVQINGKVRDRITMPADTPDDEMKVAALASENAQKYLAGKEPRKVIVVKGKLVNIVM